MESIDRSRPLVAAVLLGLCLLPLSCFQPPIREELEIRFLPQGGEVVTATVRIRAGDSRDTNHLVEDRIEEARGDLLTGQDFWSRRIAELHPPSERLIWDRQEGDLSQVVHRVQLSSPEDLRELLRGAAASVALSEGDGWAELALYPLPGVRSSEQQRRNAAASLDDWSEKTAQYVEAVVGLYRFLDDHPDRAVSCFARLFKDVPGSVIPGAVEVTDEEIDLTGAAGEAMEELLKMLEAPPDSAYTPDELFRLAYEPFPARLRVRVPGTILELEGFEPDGERGYAAPDFGLFSCVRSLEGRWVSPDPLVAFVEQGLRESDQPFDVAAFADRPRVIRSAPSPTAVRAAIASRLVPAAVYRVRWMSSAVDASPEPIRNWDAWQRAE